VAQCGLACPAAGMPVDPTGRLPWPLHALAMLGRAGGPKRDARKRAATRGRAAPGMGTFGPGVTDKFQLKLQLQLPGRLGAPGRAADASVTRTRANEAGQVGVACIEVA
jgi:hypothetical protein